MIVLDTDIVTLLSYGRNETLQSRIESVPEDEVLAVAVITRMEILQGRHDSILKAANGREMLTAAERFQAAEEMLSAFAVLHPDEASCQRFETLLKQKRRRKMKRADMVIASIALAHDALLVTRNTKDFQGVNGLRVENWAD
jgi:tRNA(fMet)-specific endonuclease VapC